GPTSATPYAFSAGAAARASRPRPSAAPSSRVLPRSSGGARRLRASSPRRMTRCRIRKPAMSTRATTDVIMTRLSDPPNDEAQQPGRLEALAPQVPLTLTRRLSRLGRRLPLYAGDPVNQRRLPQHFGPPDEALPQPLSDPNRGGVLRVDQADHLR